MPFMFDLFGHTRANRHADGTAKPGHAGRQYDRRGTTERAKTKASRRANRARRTRG